MSATSPVYHQQSTTRGRQRSNSPSHLASGSSNTEDGDHRGRATPRTPPPGARSSSMFQDDPASRIHRFERLLVVRAAPTKAFRDIIGSMSMLRPVAGPLQVQSLAPPHPQVLSAASTYGSSFGAVAEASVGLEGRVYQDSTSTTTPQASLPSVTTTAPQSSTTSLATPGSSGAATPALSEGERASAFSSAGATEVASSLARSGSVRSSRSTRSVGSTASNASGASSRRVYPIYNLEFHTLHHSVIVDAVTEERVARIHKRGVEVTDFAMLDPVIYGRHYAITSYAKRHQEELKTVAPSRTEALSHITQELKPSNLLNKFKRFSFKNLANPPPPPAESSTSVLPKRASLLRPAASEPTAISGIPTVPLFREKMAHGESNDAANISSARHAPGYVWLVRSFLRKDLIESSEELCDFTVEWRKRRVRTTRRRPVDPFTRGTQSASQSRRNSIISEADGPSTPITIGAVPSHLTPERNSSSRGTRSFDNARLANMEDVDANNTGSPQSSRLRPEGALAARMLSPNQLSRPATAPHNASQRMAQTRSQSPAPSVTDAASISNMSHTDENYDSGEESDPEDSEKPWICELVVKRPPNGSDETVSSQRFLLGTVTPAPHHPRLVAQMSIPLTLTPINIGTKGPSSIHTISPEEMKDIVTVTGLWLIVREGLGLGGVKSRKNEGSWRIGEGHALR